MTGRIIISDACVAEGIDWLGKRNPLFAQALLLTGPLPLRRGEGGFAALYDAIVSQQVSVASANAIWARLEAAGLTQAVAVAAASDALSVAPVGKLELPRPSFGRHGCVVEQDRRQRTTETTTAN